MQKTLLLSLVLSLAGFNLTQAYTDGPSYTG